MTLIHLKEDWYIIQLPSGLYSNRFQMIDGDVTSNILWNLFGILIKNAIPVYKWNKEITNE